MVYTVSLSVIESNMEKELARGENPGILPSPGESQGESADLDLSTANTVGAESREERLKVKSPLKPRRRRYSSIGGGRLHGYGEDKIRKQNPSPSADHQ